MTTFEHGHLVALNLEFFEIHFLPFLLVDLDSCTNADRDSNRDQRKHEANRVIPLACFASRIVLDLLARALHFVIKVIVAAESNTLRISLAVLSDLDLRYHR